MMDLVDLGLINYNEALKIQEELRGRRQREEVRDRLLLLEHSPVFTLGRRDCDEDIISPRETIASDGIDIIKTNRGGRITYHGPGQLVGYLICNLNEVVKSANIPPLCDRGREPTEGGWPRKCPEARAVGRKGRLGGVDLPPLTPPYTEILIQRLMKSGAGFRLKDPLEDKGGERGIKRFVFLIEELILRVIAEFGIEGCRDPEHPGIWVGCDKIAAIGLHVSRGITQHGFALNVDPNLDHYRHIIPCGIKARGVTSLGALLQKSPSMNDVKLSLITHAGSVFGANLKVNSRS
jgi:lipoate-protein ligase B